MKIIYFFAAYLISFQALAYNAYNLEAEPGLREYFNIWDYQFVVRESFSDIRGKSARVSLYNDFSGIMRSLDGGGEDESERTLYMASIVLELEWPTIMFFAEESCEDGYLDSAVINVNNQNIKTEAMCEKVVTGEYMTVYFIKNKAGNDYVINQFKDSKDVFVRFGNESMIIPFDATGFRKLWDVYGGDAL